LLEALELAQLAVMMKPSNIAVLSTFSPSHHIVGIVPHNIVPRFGDEVAIEVRVVVVDIVAEESGEGCQLHCFRLVSVPAKSL